MKKSRIFFTVCFLLAFTSKTFASRTGFSCFSDIVSIDLPEGFYTKEVSGDEKSYLLGCDFSQANAAIKIYDAKRFSSSKEALDSSMKNLKVNFESEEFSWYSKSSAFAVFDGNLSGIYSKGMAAATVIPEDSSVIFIMLWTSAQNFENEYAVFASFLDGLYVDMQSYFSKGILTSYLDSEEMEDIESGTEEKIDVNLEIDGHKIKTNLFEKDSSFAQEFIEREYKVLCLYQKDPRWKEAWQRFYRLIFRDSCARLKKVSFDIYNVLEPYCTDETDLAQKLLNWVQEFDYEREKTQSDFANLPSMLLGEGSDCDSRSLLLAVLLNEMNIDSCIFVSSEYSHAVAGLVSSHPGFSFAAGEKNYLTGETTAKNINWGNINQNQADRNKWIEVLLP